MVKVIYNTIPFCKVQKQAKLNSILFQYTYICDKIFSKRNGHHTLPGSGEEAEKGHMEEHPAKCQLLIVSGVRNGRGLAVFTVSLNKYIIR